MDEFVKKLIEKLQKEEQKEAHDYNYNAATAFHTAIQMVKQLAEEYRQDLDKDSQGWIPCSERLPEERNHNVLVTYEDRYIGGIYGVCEGQYVHGLNEWHITDYDISDDYNVIAWREKPAPYVQK